MTVETGEGASDDGQPPGFGGSGLAYLLIFTGTAGSLLLPDGWPADGAMAVGLAGFLLLFRRRA